MPEKCKPNHDAAGNDLTGQEVNYNANSGDSIVIGGLTYKVRDSFPWGIHAQRGRRGALPFTYKELLRRGAFFAKIN
jgi:hypothetical protein